LAASHTIAQQRKQYTYGQGGLLLSVLILLNSSDCDSQEQQDDRMRSLEADVKQLRAEVAEVKQSQAKPEHHFELRNEGFGTFRKRRGSTVID